MRISVAVWSQSARSLPPMFVGVFIVCKPPSVILFQRLLVLLMQRHWPRGQSSLLFPDRNQLDFLALVKVEIKIAEFNSLFAAERTACMKTDAMQHDEIGGDFFSRQWRHNKGDYAIGN